MTTEDSKTELIFESDIKTSWESLLKYDMQMMSDVIPRSHAMFAKYMGMKKEEKDANIENIKRMLKEKSPIILPNDFPYNFEDNVAHYVMWILGDHSLETTKQLASDFFKTDAKNIIVWKNEQVRKSILEIEHHHVIVYFPESSK